MEGTAYADSGVQSVEVRLENGAWQPARGREDWRADVDFSGQPFGALRVECRVADLAGNRQTVDYSSITLVKGQNAPMQQMYVSAPATAGMNETISIIARDSRGADLTGVILTVGGQNSTGDSPFEVVLGKSGPVPVELQKPGFESVSFVILGTGGSDLLIPALAIIVLAALAYFAYRKFIAKK